MLAALSIRDIVLIDRLDLEFDAGLSVLSGETGAGKSIVLDALALALGARGEAGLVPARHGLGEALVETGDVRGAVLAFREVVRQTGPGARTTRLCRGNRSGGMQFHTAQLAGRLSGAANPSLRRLPLVRCPKLRIVVF